MFEPNIVYKELISSGISTFKLNEQIWKYNEKLDDDDSKRFVSMFEDGLIKVGQ